jgi:hypothetical protein
MSSPPSGTRSSPRLAGKYSSNTDVVTNQPNDPSYFPGSSAGSTMAGVPTAFEPTAQRSLLSQNHQSSLEKDDTDEEQYNYLSSAEEEKEEEDDATLAEEITTNDTYDISTNNPNNLLLAAARSVLATSTTINAALAPATCAEALRTAVIVKLCS